MFSTINSVRYWLIDCRSLYSWFNGCLRMVGWYMIRGFYSGTLQWCFMFAKPMSCAKWLIHSCALNGNVVILARLSSLMASKVVKMTTVDATSYEYFVKMTFLFQSILWIKEPVPVETNNLIWNSRVSYVRACRTIAIYISDLSMNNLCKHVNEISKALVCNGDK